MFFNFWVLTDFRLKNGIDRSDFAKVLGVSYSHIHKIETGKREPSLDLLRAISQHTGVSMREFLSGEGESSFDKMNDSEKTASIVDLLHELNRERFTVKKLESKLLETQKSKEHVLAVNDLQEKFITILLKELSPVEKGKKTAILARAAIRAGEIRFDEVQAILHLNRRTLKEWLELEKGEYRCKILSDRVISATTPMEAGIKLGCFDCEARANENCRGYGENNYPENIFVLIALLEAHGIRSREEQSQILRDSFEMDISARQLTDVLSKQKHGKRVSEDLTNMRVRTRA